MVQANFTFCTIGLSMSVSVGKPGQENMFFCITILQLKNKTKKFVFFQNLFFFQKLLLYKSMQYQGEAYFSFFNVSSTKKQNIVALKPQEDSKTSTVKKHCHLITLLIRDAKKHG